MTEYDFATLCGASWGYCEKMPLRDISMSAESLQLVPSTTQQAMTSAENGSVFILSNHISMTSENMSGNTKRQARYEQSVLNKAPLECHLRQLKGMCT